MARLTVIAFITLDGRRTWQHFPNLWPHRDDPFSQAMNAADKAVVTHRGIDTASGSARAPSTGLCSPGSATAWPPRTSS